MSLSQKMKYLVKLKKKKNTGHNELEGDLKRFEIKFGLLKKKMNNIFFPYVSSDIW